MVCLAQIQICCWASISFWRRDWAYYHLVRVCGCCPLAGRGSYQWHKRDLRKFVRRPDQQDMVASGDVQQQYHGPSNEGDQAHTPHVRHADCRRQLGRPTGGCTACISRFFMVYHCISEHHGPQLTAAASQLPPLALAAPASHRCLDALL